MEQEGCTETTASLMKNVGHALGNLNHQKREKDVVEGNFYCIKTARRALEISLNWSLQTVW